MVSGEALFFLAHGMRCASVSEVCPRSIFGVVGGRVGAYPGYFAILLREFT